ncbi:Importin-4, partial [Pseudolycoriella hygida]
MEAIISNLLVSDNLVVQKASADLRAAFQQPDAIPSICHIIVTSEKPEIRQYAAVLLRKHIAKLRTWQAVPLELQAQIKQGTLNAILNETQKSVRNAIAQTIGVLVKHEFAKKDEWCNEVLKLIFEYTRSDDPQKSELGSSVFEILTDSSPDQLLPHMELICEMFSAAMIATAESGNMATPVILNILLGMSHLVPFILGHNGAEATYQKSIPYVVKALQCFAQQNPENFVRAFDILEFMADFTPKLLTPHLNTLIEFSLSIAHNTGFENQIRVRVVQFIGWLVKLKKKAILKNKLLEPIIGVVFMLMGTPSEDGESDDEESDGEDDYFTGNENSNPRTTATQTMDLLALHVPPEKLIPPLLQYIEPALQNPDPNQKKAAYLCLAVIAEGCSEAICTKYLKIMLNCIKTGIVDPNPVVRNAALFALGQFSEHLQPDISKYAEEILPILFEFLHQVCLQIRSGNSVKHVDRMFYALETYIENLEDALVPHLPVLMERIFETLRPENTVHLRELSMSAVASVAKAAKTQMLPYFQQIIEILKVYLVQSDNEDIVEIQPQAIDTLAALARTIGKENFMPLTNDTMTFALTLLKDASDPELRSSLYNLFAALAEVVNAEMAPVLKQIVDTMLDSVKSTDDILPEFKEDDTDG